MTSLRSAIVSNVKTTLETITAFQSVEIWMAKDSAFADTPLATIEIDGEDGLSQEGGFSLHRLNLTVKVVVAYDASTGGPGGWLDLDPLITAVQQALLVDVHRGSPSVIDTFAETFTLDEMQRDGGYLVAVMPVQVTYRHRFGDPELAP